MLATAYLKYTALVILLCSSGACHQAAHKEASPTLVAVITETPANELPNAPALSQAAINKEITAAKQATKSKLTKLQVSPPREYPNPAKLYGAPTSEIRELLGNPDFLRTDYPAHYWHYKLEICTLDFFFYPQKLQKDSLTVTHFQGRGAADIISCLKTAVDRHLDKKKG